MEQANRRWSVSVLHRQFFHCGEDFRGLEGLGDILGNTVKQIDFARIMRLKQRARKRTGAAGVVNRIQEVAGLT